MVSLSKTLVRSPVEYCVCAWNPYYKKKTRSFWKRFNVGSQK